MRSRLKLSIAALAATLLVLASPESASVRAGCDCDGGADDAAEDSVDSAANGARLWTRRR